MIPIKNKHRICEPFVDFLNITSPKDGYEQVFNALRPILDLAGMSEVAEGLFSRPNATGTFKMHSRGPVMIFGASGGFLEALRMLGLYDQYLLVFSEFDHRISMMHVTADYQVDSPRVISKVYALANKGGLFLTRKAINPLHVSKLLGQNLEGADTGTVYLGSRKNSDVWAKVYDKRQERLAKGFPDTGPLLRVEVAVQSDVGATLRDASVPRELFFHIAARSLVEPPGDLNGWAPHGAGFMVEKRPEPTTWERLMRIVESSGDVHRMFTLARAEYGDDASEELQRAIRKQYSLYEKGVASLL